MSLAAVDIAPDTRIIRGSLPLWVGVVAYAMLIIGGDRLLLDPDTQWQITVGQWILDHHAVPHTDIYSFTMRGAPWISTQWLAQVLYAEAYALARLDRSGGVGGRGDRIGFRAVGALS